MNMREMLEELFFTVYKNEEFYWMTEWWCQVEKKVIHTDICDIVVYYYGRKKQQVIRFLF